MIHPHDILRASHDRMHRLHRDAATHRALTDAHAADREHMAASGLRASLANLLRALAERLEPGPPVGRDPGRMTTPPAA